LSGEHDHERCGERELPAALLVIIVVARLFVDGRFDQREQFPSPLVQPLGVGREAAVEFQFERQTRPRALPRRPLEASPGRFEFAPLLRDPSGGDAEPLGGSLRRFAGGQHPREPPPPRRQGLEPTREVDAGRGGFGRARAAIFDHGLLPLGLAAGRRPSFVGAAATTIRRQQIASVQTGRAGPPAADMADGEGRQRTGVGQSAATAADQAGVPRERGGDDFLDRFLPRFVG